MVVKERIFSILGHRIHLPYAETVKRAFSVLSFAERCILYALIGGLTLSGGVMLWQTNQFFITEVPIRGGSLSEGVIGSPRFVNPLLAISDADRDLSSIVYSGLVKIGPSGKLIPDLAESFEISADGRTYSFILKDGLTFHDGRPLTTDDVEFTVLKAQDPALKSPKRANWDSVTMEKLSVREIHFILKQPYAPFLENTILGILPKHIWKNASAEEFALSFFNVEPTGSGPYKVVSIRRNSLGIPDRYDLAPFEDYALGAPLIEHLRIVFYQNEAALLDAYWSGDIDAVNSISPQNADSLGKSDSIIREPLPRIFAVFFNQNQSVVLANKEVRLALDQSVSRKDLVREVLGGYGVETEGPVPFGVLRPPKSDERTPEERLADAEEILDEAGWKLNQTTGVREKTVKKEKQILRFSISTGNAVELKKVAALVSESWRKLGADIEVKVFEPGDLNQNIIRPRKYDALLFGEVVGRDLDLFAFWHSSQRNDPGLNVALYTNIKADKLLAEARTISDRRTQLARYGKFEEEVEKDVPAVFLYSPEFIYALPKDVKGVSLSSITVPSDRWSGLYRWYIETEKVWTLFANK